MKNTELNMIARKQLWGRLAIHIALIATTILCGIYILPPLINVLLPFVVGLIVAWLLNPVINKIRNRIKISRRILSFVFTTILMLILGGVVVYFFYSLISQGISFVSSWLDKGGNISDVLSSKNILSDILSQLPVEVAGTIQNILTQIFDWLKSNLSSLLSTITKGVGNFLTNIPSFFASIFIAVMATYFLSSDYPSIRSSAIARFHGGFKSFVAMLQNATATAFGAYMKAQLLLSLGVFFIILIGFLLINQSYTLLLSFIFAVLDFIPLIGAGTVMVPWAIIAVITGNYTLAIQLMVIWMIIIIFRRIFEPKVVGSQTGLSPLLSLMSIYVGMRISGIMGMILGPIAFQIVFSVAKSGAFDGLAEDLKLFVNDGIAFLGNRPGNDSHDIDPM